MLLFNNIAKCNVILHLFDHTHCNYSNLNTGAFISALFYVAVAYNNGEVIVVFNPILTSK